MTPEALLTELEQRGVKVSFNGDKLRFVAPAGVLTPELKEAIAKRKPELVAWLRNPTCEVWPNTGKVVKLYRARQSCMEAGHCLQWSRETDCNLFPLTWRWGWCRERVSMRPAARSH